MRICTRISTGKIIEMQSDGTAGTLIANAVASGIPENDLLEEIVTPAEYQARMAAQAPPPIDQSDLDNITKHIKASVNLMRIYCNALKAGTYVNKSAADTKEDFKQVFNSLP